MAFGDCFKTYILRSSKVQWVLFGIDLIKEKCYVIEILRNFNSDTKTQKIQDGRRLWRSLIKKGYKEVSLKNAGNIPSILTQRLKEWNSFSYNEFNGWKNKDKKLDPWFSQGLEIDKEKNLDNLQSGRINSLEEKYTDIWEDYDENITYSDDRVAEKTQEFGDFDNYWNQEGVFEKETDIEYEYPMNFGIEIENDWNATKNRQSSINDSKNNNDLIEKKLIEEIDKYFNQKNYSEALKYANKLIEVNIYSHKGYRERGLCKLGLEDFLGAIKDFSMALKINPSDYCGFFGRGCAKRDLNDHQGAIEDFTSALKLDSQRFVPYFNRGFSRAKLNDHQGAIEDYTKYLKQDQGREDAFINRGLSRSYLNDHQGAIEDFTSALKLDSQNQFAYFNRGFSRVILKDYNGAVYDYTNHLKINPYDQNAYFNRGLSRAKLNEHEGAVLDFTTSLELNPKDDRCLLEKGLSNMALGNYLEAIENFSNALDINPKYSLAHFNKAIAYFNIQNYEESFRSFDAGFQYDSNNLDVLYLAGMLKFELGDNDGCINYLSKILLIQKDFKDVAKFLDDLKLNKNNQNKIKNNNVVNQKETTNKTVKEKEKEEEIGSSKNKSDNLIDFNAIKGEIKKFINSKKVKNIKNKFHQIEDLFINKASKAESLINPNIQTKKNQNQELSNLLNELESYVGLNSVKDEITKIINFQQIQSERNKYGLGKEVFNRHMVFYGPPGTGKSEIARLVGKIYNALGVLSKGHFIETDRSALVAGHLGQTAIKTKLILESARGGILFIDEAYTLTSNQETFDFGGEAITTILKYMEDHRDDLVIIVAGYEEEMNNFLATNPGLKSRFNSFLNFPSYSENELLEILIKLSKDKGYLIKDDSKELLKNQLAKISEFRSSQFGNARSMRNLLEIAIKNHASRVIKKDSINEDDLKYLINEDFMLKNDQYSNI